MRYTIFLLMVAFIGCGQQQNNTSHELPVKEELPAVRQKGMEITKQAFGTLSSNLKMAMGEGGVSHALKFCNIEAMPLTDSLSDHFGVEIRRVSHQPRNPLNEADSLEMKSIREYQSSIENDEELKPYTFRAEDVFIYHAPIQINNGLCLNCHGQPGTDISDQNLKVINELYPQDKATGFSMGELRGIWTIRFPEAAIDTL